MARGRDRGACSQLRPEEHRTALNWAVDVVAEGSHRASLGVRLRGGREACAHVIEASDDRGRRHVFVAKIFRPKRKSDRTESARREFRALTSFASAVPESADFGCPTPVRLREAEPPVILTTFVAGEPLGVYLRRVQPDRAGLHRLADRLLDALDVYHVATGEPYGEFHPDNILCGPGGVWLIDPATPSPMMRPLLREATSPVAADLGYLLYHLVTDWRTQIVRRTTWSWYLRFVRGLFTRAADRSAAGTRSMGVPVDTYEQALAFMDRCLVDLERRQSVRGRVLGWFARNAAVRTLPEAHSFSSGAASPDEPPETG